MLPWVHDDIHEVDEIFGGDPYPYGIEANRTTLDAFLRYAFEQGVCRRLLTAESLFPAEMHSTFRI